MEPPQAIKNLIQEFQSNNPDCNCHPYIRQYIWRNKNVYVLGYNDELNIQYVCDWVPVFYDSNGHQFTQRTGYNYLNFLEESSLIKDIWSCK